MQQSPNGPPKEKNRPWRSAGGIRVRPIKGRTGVYSYRVEVPGSITGKRTLKLFKTPEEADNYAHLMHVQRQNQGLAAFSLTDCQRSDARKALEILKPFSSVTLAAAAEFYRKHFMPEGGDITINKLIDRYLQRKEQEKLKERSLNDLTSRLKRFGLAFGTRLAKEVGAPELKTWIFDDPSLEPQTKKNYRTILHGLFSFAEAEKFIVNNPAKLLPRIKIDDAEPGIFTVPQARSLLQACLEHPELELGPYIALGLFCGIRSSELEKLTWQEVRIKEKFVTIPGKIAKKRRIRNIPLEESTISWLKAFGIETSGPIRPEGFRKRLKKLLSFTSSVGAEAVKSGKLSAEHFVSVTEWPQNGLRHSFASYYYAWSGNAQETCARLGQKSDEVLFDHYRALTRREHGAEYFALTPPEEGNLIPMPAAAAA